jgi:glycine/D-amino acid oxidase-like deaminating enzyme
VIQPLRPFEKTTPTVIDPGESLYFRPETGGLVMAGGGTAEENKDFDPDEYNEKADPSFVEHVSRQLSHRLPALDQARFMRGWAGLITTTPDYHPILGEMPGVKGFICCNGFSGHGFKLSPVIGKGVAELIYKGKAEAIELEPFNINRFAEGRTFKSAYENFPMLA